MEKPGNKIIDFGDDEYTKGRPHPMIDPGTRKEAIRTCKECCGNWKIYRRDYL
jgi:hypothetical protein